MRKGLITVEFGELVNLGKDKFNPTTNANMPCIELEHIDSGTGTINGSVDSREQKSLKNVFHKGDILFSKLRPYLRKYWFADFDGVCSSEIWVLKPKEIVLPKYIFYLIQTEEFVRISNVSSGSKMPRADWDFINHYPLTIIHSIPEQQRIVSLLSFWDTAIAKQTALIEQLTLRKRGLMQQLLTGKKRLKGFGGEWKKCTYSNILSEVKRTLIWDEDELYKLISVRRRSEGLFFRESLYGREIATKNLRPAKTGDFLISKMQIVHGASGLVTEEFDDAKISGSYISLVSKNSDVLDIKYFNLWSQTPIFYHQTFVSSFGVHIEKMTFDFDTFMSFSMPLPPIKEQHAIVSLMDSINKEIELANKKLARLQEEKKGLMQVLLTGKKRIEI